MVFGALRWLDRKPFATQLIILVLIFDPIGAIGGYLLAPTLGVDPIIGIGYGLAVLMKIAQGSGTVSMMAASAMVASFLQPEVPIGIHPVYIALAIGFGSLTVSWMNDSGFWVFSQMGGLTEWETIRTWTALLTLMSVLGMTLTTLAALLFPMTNLAQ